MEDNICKFAPTYSADNELSIINFVCEKQHLITDYRLKAVYTLNLITKGSGILHTPEHSFGLKPGDLFITVPAKRYYVENAENLEYIYISFIGMRGAELLSRISFDRKNPVYNGFGTLIEFWENNVKTAAANNIDILAEAVLLYTFSHICFSVSAEKRKKAESADKILRIKQYVDSHYTEYNISLRNVSVKFSYSYKYI